MSNWQCLEVTAAEADLRLDQLLARRFPLLGRRGAALLCGDGLVRAEGRPVGKATKLPVGTRLEIALRGLRVAVPNAALPLTVIQSDESFLVVHKPAGQPTAPRSAEEVHCLANALLGHFPELATIGHERREPGLVHRLDTGTSGLLLVARSEEAFQHATSLLRAGLLEKRYLALTDRPLPAEEGTVSFPLAHGVGDAPTVTWCLGETGQRTTHYRRLASRGRLSLVEVTAHRAFRHQVRAHLAAIGCPLLGDEAYGGSPEAGLTRHALHASHLQLPSSRRFAAITADLPLEPDLAAIWEGPRG